MRGQPWAALVEALSGAIGDRVGIAVAAGATLLTGSLLVYYTPQILSEYTECALVGLLLLFVFVGSIDGSAHSGIECRRNRAAETRRALDMLASLSAEEKKILKECVVNDSSSVIVTQSKSYHADLLCARGILALVDRIPLTSDYLYSYIVDSDIWNLIEKHGLFKED